MNEEEYKKYLKIHEEHDGNEFPDLEGKTHIYMELAKAAIESFDTEELEQKLSHDHFEFLRDIARHKMVFHIKNGSINREFGPIALNYAMELFRISKKRKDNYYESIHEILNNIQTIRNTRVAGMINKKREKALVKMLFYVWSMEDFSDTDRILDVIDKCESMEELYQRIKMVSLGWGDFDKFGEFKIAMLEIEEIFKKIKSFVGGIRDWEEEKKWFTREIFSMTDGKKILVEQKCRDHVFRNEREAFEKLTGTPRYISELVGDEKVKEYMRKISWCVDGCGADYFFVLKMLPEEER